MSRYFRTLTFFVLCFVYSSIISAQDYVRNRTFTSKQEDGRILQQPPRMHGLDSLINSYREKNRVISDYLIDRKYDFYTLYEEQLGEDEDIPESTPHILSSTNSFISEAAYRFTSIRFRTRAYHSRYSNVYANGVLVNDAERGEFYYRMLGELNDVIRNKEGATYLEYTSYGTSTVGGSGNINMRASQHTAGHKVTLTGCNRNYLARAMYTYSTGELYNGWALTASASYRWSNEGAIEGTFYNSISYFLAAEKKINYRHSISVATWGSPTERAQHSASTQEAYWLAESHYYNSNWGYYNGKKRNARTVSSYEPAALITWDFLINDNIKFSTSLFGKYSRYNMSALAWNKGASDPHPDYYLNMPSTAYDVSDPDYTPTTEELEAFNVKFEYWKSDRSNRQINWNDIYTANQQAYAENKESLYYIEKRHSDQFALNLGSKLDISYNYNSKGTFGLDLGTTKGMHYKTMKDLLGGKPYLDIEKNSTENYGANSNYVQNDVDNPNRLINEGDVFGYDYDINVNKVNLYYQHLFTKGIFRIFGGANIEAATIERYGNMRNGRADNFSKGSSGTSLFIGGGGKIGIAIPFNAYNTISFGGGYECRTPLACNAFLAPRMRNDFVIGLTNEKLMNAEASYKFKYGPVMAQATAYCTKFNDIVEHNTFYNDRLSQYTFLTMTGISKLHYGIEAAVTYDITPSLSINALASIGNAEYIGNANAFLMNESEESATNDKAYIDGIKVGSTPFTALSIGGIYKIKGWYICANVNYYDNIYVNASGYARLATVLGNPVIDQTTGEEVFDIPSQYKGKGGLMVDASIGKSISFKNKKRVDINLSLDNILNNRKMITGGYEQNRKESKSDDGKHIYKFSENPYLYYANAFNAYLNIGINF